MSVPLAMLLSFLPCRDCRLWHGTGSLLRWSSLTDQCPAVLGMAGHAAVHPAVRTGVWLCVHRRTAACSSCEHVARRMQHAWTPVQSGRASVAPLGSDQHLVQGDADESAAIDCEWGSVP